MKKKIYICSPTTINIWFDYIELCSYIPYYIVYIMQFYNNKRRSEDIAWAVIMDFLGNLRIIFLYSA